MGVVIQRKTLIDNHPKTGISRVAKMLGFGLVGYFCWDEFLLNVDNAPSLQKKETCKELLYGVFIGMANQLALYFRHGQNFSKR